MERKWTQTAALAVLLTGIFCGSAYGFSGQWLQTEQGRQYILEDGNPGGKGWQDIEGEWYYLDKDGLALTGWQSLGNLRYYFEEDGRLAEGWRYDGDNDHWYFYDKSGNAVIRWLYDEERWYWFNGDGTLSLEPVKTIGGKEYFFNSDGSLRANSYDGFRYYDADGLRDSLYDMWAVDGNGQKMEAREEEWAAIAEEVNGLPKGWLKKFLNNGWTFLYCPEDGVYRSASFSGKEDWYEKGKSPYEICYKLDNGTKTLRFSEKDAIKAGFGEYVYEAMKPDFPEAEMRKNLGAHRYRVMELLGLPEAWSGEYRLQFGAMFAAYFDEESRMAMEARMDGLSWAMDRVIHGLEPDGSLREKP